MNDTDQHEPRDYEILDASGEQVDRFRTAATAGGSADENAVRNLLEHSRFHDGRFLLRLLFPDGAAVPLAHASDGVGTLLVDLDSLAADSMHGQLEPPAMSRRNFILERLAWSPGIQGLPAGVVRQTFVAVTADRIAWEGPALFVPDARGRQSTG